VKARARTLDPARLGDHIDRLYRAAWALCGDRDQAEDLVQETYARVLSRRRLLRRDDDLGYLLTALRNTFYHQLRKEKRQLRGEEVSAESDPVDQSGHMRPERELEAREVYRAIAQLDDDSRAVIIAVDVTGLSYEEAAKALDVPVGTLRSRLFRAREKTTQLLGSEGREAR
jgi:RNA polymerase sigma-70 factor, ECF subfamily